MLRLWLQRIFYRLRWWIGAAPAPSKELLAELWNSPLAPGGSQVTDCEFLVVDTETSSLSAKQGELVSIGWVVIREGRVVLTSAEHHLLQTIDSVGHSATIHQIRDCELETARDPIEVMQQLFGAAAGRILVFHNAMLDLAFINKLCWQHCQAPLLMPVADTMAIERKSLERRDIPLGPQVLRLASCRARYNLPAGQAHNALQDALDTAELLLAQIAYKGSRVQLRELLS